VDLYLWHAQVFPVEDQQIRQFPGLQAAKIVLAERQPGVGQALLLVRVISAFSRMAEMPEQ
jgi:hypothetical protein